MVGNSILPFRLKISVFITLSFHSSPESNSSTKQSFKKTSLQKSKNENNSSPVNVSYSFSVLFLQGKVEAWSSKSQGKLGVGVGSELAMTTRSEHRGLQIKFPRINERSKQIQGKGLRIPTRHMEKVLLCRTCKIE